MASHFAKKHDVNLFVAGPVDLDVVYRTFGIELSGVRIIICETSDHASEIAKASPDLFINNSHSSDLACPAPAGIYMCMFPAPGHRNVGSYDVVTANSAYTAHWIQKRWSLKAETVYSACESMGPARTKEKLILNVGRFSADHPQNHHKRQEILIKAFAELGPEIAEGWKMQFVGTVQPGEEGSAFAEHVATLGGGLPVNISHGLGFEDLRETYRRAAIYWHATGFGADPELQPDKQEHFGMAVVEAMSGGAVPIVFDGGGPREIVERGVSGEVWSTPDDLVAQTRSLIASSRRLNGMSRRALKRSRAFTARAFLLRMDAIVDRLADKLDARR